MHALTGAYAVDALDQDERSRFEAHLAECADCREEVAGLSETAALLQTPVEPPAYLRDAVLAGIEEVRPLPPIVANDEIDGTNKTSANVTSLESRRDARRMASRLPLLVAAAIVLIMGVGAMVLRPWAGDSPTPDGPTLTAAERVLQASDAQEVNKRFLDGAEATVIVSRTEGRAVIKTDDMAPAPEGKVYELWLQTPAGELKSAGLMPDLRDATVLLEGDASRATGVGITIEPDGGSERPTSEPIAFFTLST